MDGNSGTEYSPDYDISNLWQVCCYRIIVKGEKIIIFFCMFFSSSNIDHVYLLWGLATKERRRVVAGDQRGMVIPELNVLPIAIFPIFSRSVVIGNRPVIE